MNMKRKLIVIMPVYNEEGAIGPVLEKWVSALNSLDLKDSFQIHVYNDGSKDRTAEILQICEKQHPGRIIVHNKSNSGHGSTILQGYMENAGLAEWLFQIDSDDEMGPENFKDLWDRREDYDFLLGQRSGRKQQFSRGLVSFLSRQTVRFLYSRKIQDVNSPYRLMRSSVFKDIFGTIPADTFAPNVILSGMAGKKRLRCLEMPVPQRERQTGEVSLKKWKLMKSAVKSFGQTIRHGLQYGNGLYIFGFAALLALLLRLFVSGFGWNFDFESYQLVADLMKDGKTVYAETARYNYGPVWFYVLHCLKTLFGCHFRTGLILFLTLCDFGIAALLWRKSYRFAALLFLLSPVTIYTTGWHNQFDNFAVFTAMLSVAVLSAGKEPEQNLSFRKILAGGILLGISLMTKHIFIFFVFWLFLRFRSWGKKLLVLLVPLLIFAGGFLPFVLPEVSDMESRHQIGTMAQMLLKGQTGQAAEYRNTVFFKNRPVCRNIWTNIITYQSYNNKILHTWCLPRILQMILPAGVLFFGGMLILGFAFRKTDIFISMLYYTAFLLILSVAITNQYLAIPAAFAAVFAQPFGLLYHLLGFVPLLGRDTYYGSVYLAAVLLLVLIMIQQYRKPLLQIVNRIAVWLDHISPD